MQRTAPKVSPTCVLLLYWSYKHTHYQKHNMLARTNTDDVMPEKIRDVAESKLILSVMQRVARFDVATRSSAAVFLSTRRCPVQVKLSK